MNAWALIVIFNAGLQSAAPLVIADIASYEECARLSVVVQSAPSLATGPYGYDYKPDSTRLLCVPYKKAVP